MISTRLHCVLPIEMDAPAVRDGLHAALRRRRRVRPCVHGDNCVCRRSSTARRYGRTRPRSYHVRVRVDSYTAARVEELAVSAGVPIGQAVRDLLGV